MNRSLTRLALTTLLAAGGVALAGAPPATATGPCDGPANVILGTNGNDVLNGTPGRDYIDGRGGNDIIRGGGGNDTLVGGEGNDLLIGGKGDDCVSGGAGSDRVYGDADSHDPNTDTGQDQLDGGPGSNDWYWMYEQDETSNAEKGKH